MKAASFLVAVSLAVSAGFIGACSPHSGPASTEDDPVGLLPSALIGDLAPRRMSVVWAPEMNGCGVCSAPVAKALTRFAEDFPEADVMTALEANKPFPPELVVGRKMLVPDETAAPASDRRPYLAILDSDRRLLTWRRIADFGRQDELVYQELLAAYSLTAPLE